MCCDDCRYLSDRLRTQPRSLHRMAQPQPPCLLSHQDEKDSSQLSSPPTHEKLLETNVGSIESPSVWSRVYSIYRCVLRRPFFPFPCSLWIMKTHYRSNHLCSQPQRLSRDGNTDCVLTTRKNYCPIRAPLLFHPIVPTESEKYSYVDMQRSFLIICTLVALLSLLVGAWGFARASPAFAWYTIYVLIAQFYLFVSVFVSIFGAQFTRAEHEKILKDNPLAEHAPTVDIYLPVRKEPLETLQNTWRNVAALQYPAGRKEVFVLDDGADDCVRMLAQRFDFNYICRPDRPIHKKAGNIRYAYTQTSGEFFVVFDADFCPRFDFLLEVIPYHIANPKRAIVQTPQFFSFTSEKTWTEKGAGASLELTFRLLQTCRDTWGASLCVGTNAVYRRAALEPVGGCLPVEASEDIATGFWAITHGWTGQVHSSCLMLWSVSRYPSSLLQSANTLVHRNGRTSG